MIGVAAEAQGSGHGRHLIEKFHEMSDKDAESTGVWLDTENPKNVSWYASFGYQVRAQSQLGDVTIWGMFRPK